MSRRFLCLFGQYMFLALKFLTYHLCYPSQWQSYRSEKKKLYSPFLWMGFNYPKARATLRREFTFYHLVPINSWYSFYRPRKYERLSWPWSHPVVLNTGPLDGEFSTLTTRPLLYKLFKSKFPSMWHIAFG